MRSLRRNRLFINRAASVLLFVILTIALAAGSRAYLPHSEGPAGTAPPSNAPRQQILVLHVYFHDNAERDRLASELGAEEADTRGGYLTVFADNNLYTDLQRRGLRVEIDQATTYEANHPDVLFSKNPGPGPVTFDTGYRTVEEMQAFLDAEVAAHPTLAQKVDFGDSWCKTHPNACLVPTPYQGNDLWVLHITNQAIPGPKPVFWYDGAIHSREIAVPEVAMRYISWLLDGYTTNADAHWLVDYNDIWVVPMLNPDGHHVVEQGDTMPFAQRKNLDNANGCAVYPPTGGNQLGTDLNRNFSFLWNCCGGSSSSSCNETYHGPSAASDDETQAVQNQVRTLVPDQRGPNNNDPAPITTTGIMQTMHSNASLDLYPWGWTGTAPPNGTDLANIGAHESATNAGGNGYSSCQPPNCLYAVDGDSMDWAYGELGMAAFSTEIEGSSFYPPYATIDTTIWPHNKGLLIYLAKLARTPYLTTRGPDPNSVVATPMTVTQGTTSQLTGSMNYNWTGDRYMQNVADAEYYIDTPPWSGGSSLPMSGDYSSQTVAVSATVDTTGLTPGRHILFVRGRGVNDYSGLHSWGPISATFLDVLSPAVTPTPAITATPTWTPVSGNSLTGHVTWQGRPAQPNELQQLAITVTLKSPLTEVNYTPQSTDASGFFTVSVSALPPGVYQFRVKDPKYLANSGNVVLVTGNTQQEIGLMRAGDASNDNTVNVQDFNILKVTFGKSVGDPGYDDRADFTGDQTVNISDFNLLKQNFGTTGAPPIGPVAP